LANSPSFGYCPCLKRTVGERKNREKQIAETAKSNSKKFWSYVNSKRKTKSGVSELHTERDGIKIIASFF
jgi:hypothetical protein